MGAEALQIPLFGLYGACSTSGEALALSSMCVAAGYADLVLAEEETLELLSVFAKGVLMIHEKEVLVKGTFE